VTLNVDIQKQATPALVDLYILDLNSINVASVLYFYPGTDADSTPVEYLGNTYQPWPVSMSGFEKRGTGSESRPKASISNINGEITQQLQLYDDLIGAQLKRRRTLQSYVIANVAEYAEEIYFIEQKTVENSLVVEFELSSALDFIDKRLPGRIAVANACPWRYKSTANGSGCSWPGTNPAKWFDRQGNAVLTAGEDQCGKRLSDCKLRFGANAELDFGGFPSLGRNG
jgi:lambda family phage minor tail protein L